MKIVYNVNLFCQNTRLIPLSEDLKRERGLFVLPITNCWLFHISAWKMLVHELHLHPLGTVIWLLKNGCLLHCHFDTVMNTCMSRALTVGPVHTVCVAASDVRSRLGSKTKQQAKASKLTISASSQPESKATSGVFSRLGKKSAASWYHLWHFGHKLCVSLHMRVCCHWTCLESAQHRWHPCFLLGPSSEEHAQSPRLSLVPTSSLSGMKLFLIPFGFKSGVTKRNWLSRVALFALF